MKRVLVSLIFLLAASRLEAATNYKLFVYVSNASTAPAKIAGDLLASVTTQFQGKLVPSFVAGQYTYTITGEGPAPLPADAFSSACAYCFGNGMMEERNQDVNILWALQMQDFNAQTCGGAPYISSAGVTNCLRVYNTAVSTISLRDCDVFTDTGAKVSGP